MFRCACAETLLSRDASETEVIALDADVGPLGAPGAPELSACSVKIIFSTEIEMYYHCTFAVNLNISSWLKESWLPFEAHTSQLI